jgi:hypothetical protein
MLGLPRGTPVVDLAVTSTRIKASSAISSTSCNGAPSVRAILRPRLGRNAHAHSGQCAKHVRHADRLQCSQSERYSRLILLDFMTAQACDAWSHFGESTGYVGPTTGIVGFMMTSPPCPVRTRALLASSGFVCLNAGCRSPFVISPLRSPSAGWIH